MAKESFLSYSVEMIRRSIRGLDESYNNPWDILAELSQNSVDAIYKMQRTSNEIGEIIIDIDSQKKNIIFKDNGCGIAYDDLPRLLNLFSSGKYKDPSSVGEKGVGLKFAMFQSNEFEIVSSDGNGAGKAIVKNARLWKKSDSDDELLLDREKLAPFPHGTTITLRDVEIETYDKEAQVAPLFQLTFSQLKYILRNKTYLGLTKSLWEDSVKPIKIILKYRDFNGNDYKEELKNEYALPIEGLSSSDIIDFEEYKKWLNTTNRTEEDKRRKLRGKIVVKKGSYLHKNYRKIFFWVCYLPRRRNWDYINKNFDLEVENNHNDTKELNEYYLFSSGIYTSTKGMPTGIPITIPSTGALGYWPNFFMLFQDDALTFDIGRKSIHNKIQSIYQEKARDIFNEYMKYIVRYMPKEPVISKTPGEFDRDEIRDKIKEMMELQPAGIIPFEKSPHDQEAAVAAVFYEMIGAKIIKDIVPIFTGYRNKYDMYANNISSSGKKKFGIYEFKSHLAYLKKDFDSANKIFEELNYVICWNVTDNDIQALNLFGIECEEVDNSPSWDGLEDSDIPESVSHRMSISTSGKEVYVIDLKRFLVKYIENMNKKVF